MLVWKLPLYKAAFRHVQHHSELIFQTINKMPKANRDDDSDNQVPPHGTINEEEAEQHRLRLEKMMDDLRRSTMEENIREIMGDFVVAVKACCEKIYPPLTGTDAQKVLHSMGDPYGLVLQEQTEEVENRLELCMLEEELLKTDEMIWMASSMEPLSDEARATLTNLMEHIAEAHYQAAQAAENLAQLSRPCTSSQLMTIMKFAARPLILLEGTPGPIGERSTLARKRDLPEAIENRINLTLLPNPDADSLKRESATSPTRLLAGIVFYQIKKNSGGGCTQILVTSKFGLKHKTVALCLTGRKYQGGKDSKRRTKCKALDDSPKPSTSAQ